MSYEQRMGLGQGVGGRRAEQTAHIGGKAAHEMATIETATPEELLVIGDIAVGIHDLINTTERLQAVMKERP